MGPPGRLGVGHGRDYALTLHRLQDKIAATLHATGGDVAGTLTACNLVAYDSRMNAVEQARSKIVLAINTWRRENANDDEVARPLAALAAEAGVSVSMLYQFMRQDGPKLGTDSVPKLRPLLDKYLVEPGETWLAAMGVETPGLVEAQA